MSTVGVASSHSMTASSELPGAGFTDRLLIVASLRIQKGHHCKGEVCEAQAVTHRLQKCSGWSAGQSAPSTLRQHTPAGAYAACLGAGQAAVHSSSAPPQQAAAPAMPTLLRKHLAWHSARSASERRKLGAASQLMGWSPEGSAGSWPGGRRGVFGPIIWQRHASLLLQGALHAGQQL